MNKYEYIGTNKCNSFKFDGTDVDLNTITDIEIELLIKYNPLWNNYFAKKKKPKEAVEK